MCERNVMFCFNWSINCGWIFLSVTQIYSEKKIDPSCRNRTVELSAAEFSSFFFFLFLHLNTYERGVWKSDEVVYIAT